MRIAAGPLFQERLITAGKDPEESAPTVWLLAYLQAGLNIHLRNITEWERLLTKM